MPLYVTYSFGEGITVPYEPIFDDIRKNRGFIDVRGKPDLAAKIAECQDSPALRTLLADIAFRSRYFSLGSDLGQHREENLPVGRRCVAGGYVQVSGYLYALLGTSDYDNFCRLLVPTLRAYSKGERWRIDFRGTWVAFELPEEERVTKPSMWIWFFAHGRTHDDAVASRERLLAALQAALNRKEVFRTLAGVS